MTYSLEDLLGYAISKNALPHGDELRAELAELRQKAGQLEHYRGTCDDCEREGVLVDHGMGVTFCAFDREECKRLTQERRDALIAQANRDFEAEGEEGG